MKLRTESNKAIKKRNDFSGIANKTVPNRKIELAEGKKTVIN